MRDARRCFHSSFTLHPSSLRSRAFVFLAALGVMVIAFLIVFVMSGTTQFTYHGTERSLGEVQEQIMARSAADYALLLILQNKMTTDGKPQPFKIANDQLRGGKVVGTVAATAALPAHAIYQQVSLAHRQGDVLVHVVSPQMRERYGRGERYLLCNVAGQRLRPIDVTAAIR